jgi:glycosyltransferase involved in cell wall biosynthesis
MTLDICFGGVRYTPTGTDKGYDLFIAAAHRLKDRFPHLRFHVFGDYTPDILDVGDLGERIRFYGLQPQSWLATFYADMDAIVSPNRPHQITRGAFDGFPVTTCIEAAMCGTALFATDPMKLNFALTDGLDYVAIDADAVRLADCLESWLTQPDALYALAAAGERTTRAVWGEAAQMGPRVELFKRLLGR